MIELAILGVDGTGKSSLTNRLDDWLNEEGYSSSCLKLPRYDTTPSPANLLGKLVDKIALTGDRKSSKKLITLGYGSAVSIYRVGRKLSTIGEPDVLLSERHPVVDSLAYSSVYGSKYLVKLSELFAGKGMPDFITYLRADASTCLDRILGRFEESGYDRKSMPHFHERIGYLKRLDKAFQHTLKELDADYAIIDTTNKSKKEVFNEALEEFKQYLK